jgi:hypothetical protein
LYAVFFATVVSANVVIPAPTCAICAKFVQFGFLQRSILNPLSLFELSLQERLMRVFDTAVALRPLGAAGSGGGGADVVALAVFENAELPATLKLATR